MGLSFNKFIMIPIVILSLREQVMGIPSLKEKYTIS